MALIASALTVTVTFIAAIVPGIRLAGGGGAPPYPAPPGYLLPWAGGEIHSVTQGEETSFTHNGAAAYAYDLDLNYETVVAARSGRVTMVRQDSNVGGCDGAYSSMTNYVVIDHGDGTSGAYLHLAYNGVLVQPGQLVEQGQPIAISGETGVTCGADGGPGPHLHFQVQRTQPAMYFTQSLPVAFDDIASNNGVLQEGRSYVSGNFGRGKEQKIALTPRRVPRVYNPLAQPAYPSLKEADRLLDPNAKQTPPPDAPPLVWPTPAPTGTPTPPPAETPQGGDTPTPEAAATDTPPAEAPRPADTPAPTPPPPPTAAPSDTPTATATATPTSTPTAPANTAVSSASPTNATSAPAPTGSGAVTADAQTAVPAATPQASPAPSS